MSNAATDDKIYHNGRTHEQHCAWLDSLVGDDYRVAYMPTGYLFDLAEISFYKFALLNIQMTAEQRLKTLSVIAQCVFGPVTEEAVAAIEPCCKTCFDILREIHSLPVEKQSWAFQTGDVFRLLAKLNPSLLTALRLSRFGKVPDKPRASALEEVAATRH